MSAALVRQADRSSCLRIITDNNRHERPYLSLRGEHHHPKLDKQWNTDAGQQTLHFMREWGLTAPLLVLTDNQKQTKYVLNYNNAGSTAYRNVAKEFIISLAEGEETGSTGWGRWAKHDLRLDVLVNPHPVLAGPSNASLLPREISSSRLLISVDDEPHQKTDFVELARHLGVEVREFATTSSATQWIVANQRKHLKPFLYTQIWLT